MKKIAAFLTATLLFLCFAVAVHFIVLHGFQKENKGFGTWINSYKDMSYSAIDKNLHDDTLLVLGSSEFQHGKNTEYHPTQIFRGMNKDVMCVGAAYNQCLSHTITLGALAPDLKSKKVVLILSPAWFDKKGVTENGFAVRFSESQYMALLNNNNLSKGLKQEIAKRTQSLLNKAPAMQENVKKYNDILLNKQYNPIDRMYFSAKKIMLNEREAVNTSSLWRTSGKPQYNKYKKHITGKEPNWDELVKKADKEYETEATNNEFYIRDSIYNKKFLPVLSKQKNSMSKREFWRSSPEYGDLDLFLRVAKESNIDVMLILLPMNGYWYDYTGFNQKARDVLPGQIKEVTDKYNVEFCDFFNEEYNPGFLEDAFHPAGKGWTLINEKINEFYDKNKDKNKGNNK